MSKIQLSKELIESIVADRYVGAANFSWDNNTVSFDYEDSKNFESYNRKNMIDNINNLSMELLVLQGKLEQSSSDFKILLRECFNT